jgi:hypothetical protein
LHVIGRIVIHHTHAVFGVDARGDFFPIQRFADDSSRNGMPVNAGNRTCRLPSTSGPGDRRKQSLSRIIAAARKGRPISYVGGRVGGSVRRKRTVSMSSGRLSSIGVMTETHPEPASRYGN